MIIFKKAGNTMKNVKENKRRWKQLVAIFIVAVMLFTTPHIVGFASMGKEEATTAAADGNPDNSDVKVQSEDADSEEDIQTESLDASEQSESSEEKTTEKKTETTEAEKKTGADESKKEKAEETTKIKSVYLIATRDLRISGCNFFYLKIKGLCDFLRKRF